MKEKHSIEKKIAEGVLKQKIEGDSTNDFLVKMEPGSEIDMRTSEHEYLWVVESGVGLLTMIEAGHEHRRNIRVSSGIGGELHVGDQFGVLNIGREILEVLVTKLP